MHRYIAGCYGFPLARTSGAFTQHPNPDVYFHPGDYTGRHNDTMALAYCVCIPSNPSLCVTLNPIPSRAIADNVAVL